MKNVGKWLIIIGSVLFIAGLILLFIEKQSGGWRIPGDVVIKRENFTLYFPLGTSIVISLIVSLLFYIVSKLK